MELQLSLSQTDSCVIKKLISSFRSQKDIEGCALGFGGGEIDFAPKVTFPKDFHAVGPQPPLGPFC